MLLLVSAAIGFFPQNQEFSSINSRVCPLFGEPGGIEDKTIVICEIISRFRCQKQLCRDRQPMKTMVQGRPAKESLLRFFILILTAMDQTVMLLAAPGSSQRPADKRTYVKDAIKCSLKDAFPCKPQLRSYNLKDLVNMQDSIMRNVELKQPAYIVQRRCDSHSGCCSSQDQSCVPSQIEHEQIEIEIENLNERDTKKIWIRIEQHKKCACAPSSWDMRNRTDLPPTIQEVP